MPLFFSQQYVFKASHSYSTKYTIACTHLTFNKNEICYSHLYWFCLVQQPWELFTEETTMRKMHSS